MAQPAGAEAQRLSVLGATQTATVGAPEGGRGNAPAEVLVGHEAHSVTAQAVNVSIGAKGSQLVVALAAVSAAANQLHYRGLDKIMIQKVQTNLHWGTWREHRCSSQSTTRNPADHMAHGRSSTWKSYQYQGTSSFQGGTCKRRVCSSQLHSQAHKISGESCLPSSKQWDRTERGRQTECIQDFGFEFHHQCQNRQHQAAQQQHHYTAFSPS